MEVVSDLQCHSRGRSQIMLAREGGGGRQNANGLLTRGEGGSAFANVSRKNVKFVQFLS